MAESIHSDYDGINCNPDPWTSTKGPIFDLILAIIIAIIEDILDTEATYMKITYISGDLKVYLEHGDAFRMNPGQREDVLESSSEILVKMDFTLDDPLEDFEIIYDNE